MTPDDELGLGERLSISEALVVSPAWGRVKAEPLRKGQPLEKGAIIGRLHEGADVTPLVCHTPAVFLAWLVHEGDRVAPGTRLARVRPAEASVRTERHPHSTRWDRRPSAIESSMKGEAMRVGVIGTGHVGLITSATLAAEGHVVVGTDQDPEKIAMLRQGRAPFYEPGIDELLTRGLEEGTLAFTSDPAEAISGAEVVLIAVGTPPRASGEANVVAVERAARTVARHVSRRCVVVEKSTVPTGTAKRLRTALMRENPDSAHQLEVVSNPEFLREGSAVEDSLRLDRILIGAESPWAFETMRRLYAPQIEGGCTLIETDVETAELAKHACNAFLALRISFANALARLCERSGADVVSVTNVMGTDPRIGSSFIKAGLGYGGSCFPKDLQAFERMASGLGYDFPILKEIARINDEAVRATLNKIRDALWNLEDKRVALLGLAFKAGTDDVRFSPALALGRLLMEEGATVVGYDLQAEANAKAELPGLEVAPDPYDASTGAHCAVICTEWEEFLSLDLARLKDLMAYPIIVDGRNMLDPEAMRTVGFTYYPTGRPPVV